MKTATVIPQEHVACTVNFAKILPLFEQAVAPSLLPSFQGAADARVIKAGPSVAMLQPLNEPTSRRARLQKLPRRQFSVPVASGYLSRAAGIAALQTLGQKELELPFGMPRIVNAATLKRMLKAKRGDVLLRRVGLAWEVCENATKVDLTDDSVEFRLGHVQIFS